MATSPYPLLNRRRFLQWQAAGALSLAGGGLGVLRPSLSLAADAPDVAVAKGSPAAAVRAAVRLLGGMQAFVKSGDRVVIKPNMSFANPPEMATTTNPEVIRELAVMCREAGASRVDILDNTLSAAEMCLEQTGIRDACRGLDFSVEGVDDARRYREIGIPGGKSMKRTEVMREVLEADVLIAAPVAKHHSSAGVSLSMKGNMGLILNRSVMHWKYNLHESIVDLSTLLKADLAVIDVTRALTTNGPGGPGEVVRHDTVIASPDMVAADAKATAMVQWYGRSIEPRQVKHIKIAHERGLGRMDIENLRIAETLA
jgi:uncharacterized protein (DUF362 family)